MEEKEAAINFWRLKQSKKLNQGSKRTKEIDGKIKIK